MSDPGGDRCAVLTPPGAGAIAVIRVAGPNAFSIRSSLFRSKRRAVRSGGEPSGSNHAPGEGGPTRPLRYGEIVAGGEVIDDVIVCDVCDAPGPAVDICCHGGVRVVERILEALEALGARLDDDLSGVAAAWAFGNRIELEANQALLRAKTARCVRFLSWQRGRLPPALAALRDAYAERPEAARRRLRAMVGGYRAATRLMDGIRVALVGPPNSGKSTLFNALAGRKSAVVSAAAGTTRDWVSQDVELGGIPATLIDTAGRHGAGGSLERRAIDGGARAAAEADVRLAVLDGSRPLGEAAWRVALAAVSGGPGVLVANKSDLDRVWTEAVFERRAPRLADNLVRASALTGDGVDSLVAQILRTLDCDVRFEDRPCLFTSRQACIAEAMLAGGAEAWLRGMEAMF